MSHLEAIRKYWNLRSAGYRQQIEKEQSEGVADFYAERFSRIPTGSRVLDIGCGPGFFSAHLASNGFKVTAADYSEKMLEEAKSFAASRGVAPEEFVRADAQNLPFENNTFDAVVSRNLLWNLENPEKAYKEWMRVLKPGGTLFVFDGNHYRHLFDEDYASLHEDYSKSSNHILLGVKTDTIDKIAETLPLSSKARPQWDTDVLKRIGADAVDSEIIAIRNTADGKSLTMHFAVYAKKPL